MKRYGLFAFLVVAALVVAASSTGGTRKSQKPFDGITVNVVTFTGPQIAEPLQRRAPAFGQLTGAKITHIPYRNIAQYGPDLIAGTVALGFQWFPNVAFALNAKGAKALAVAGANRLEALPDVPTSKEAGLPDYEVSGWFALLAPKGTPAPIVNKLNSELAAALADRDVRARFQTLGAEPVHLPPDQAKEFISKEIRKYHDIVINADIPPIE